VAEVAKVAEGAEDTKEAEGLAVKAVKMQELLVTGGRTRCARGRRSAAGGRWSRIAWAMLESQTESAGVAGCARWSRDRRSLGGESGFGETALPEAGGGLGTGVTT